LNDSNQQLTLEMKTSLSQEKIISYLTNQLCNIFPDNSAYCELSRIVPRGLERLEYCLEKSIYKPYRDNGICYFNHLNADQYTVFLYYCSNIAYLEFSNLVLAQKLFYLNKVLHSFHCMYDTILPDIFLIVHGNGTVLGKAKYSNYLVVMHGCTVGANSSFELPIIGEYVS